MNLFFGSPLIGFIILDIVIVVLLYGAAYIGFLAILRHPRNWRTIPAWEKALVTLSLILNIAFCSVSTTGVDYPALVASGIFLVFLFFIIGAPSFALNQDAPLQWEFLARHSDRLVLGLLLAVVITGYWVSSIKLNALFGIAIFIEVIWLLRLHRANQFRRERPLNEHSLAVLGTQTGDDLESFIKKHRIRELVKYGNEIRWVGCSVHSPPCPINYYVNKLGLNTPHCCLEHMKDLCFAVDRALTELAVLHWIDGGTLLGVIREAGHFLAWEDDVDISFMLEDSTSWDLFVSELTFKLTQHDYTVRSSSEDRPIYIYYTPPTRWLYGLEQHRYRGEIRVDLIGNRVAESYGQKVMERPLLKGAMPKTERGRYGVPMDMIMPTSETELLGKMVSCPRNSDAYLRTLYGNYTEVEYTYVDNQVACSRKNIDEAGDPELAVKLGI